MKNFVVPLTIFLIVLMALPALARVRIHVSPDPFGIGTITASELDMGYVERTMTATIEISAKSDESWKLQVKADDVSGWSPKEISDFMWRVSGSGSYTKLTDRYKEIAAGTGNSTLYMDYKILVSWEDGAASYVINLKYEAKGL
jgi:hypothetical protein